jgi:hypothetical protein
MATRAPSSLTARIEAIERAMDASPFATDAEIDALLKSASERFEGWHAEAVAYYASGLISQSTFEMFERAYRSAVASDIANRETQLSNLLPPMDAPSPSPSQLQFDRVVASTICRVIKYFADNVKLTCCIYLGPGEAMNMAHDRDYSKANIIVNDKHAVTLAGPLKLAFEKAGYAATFNEFLDEGSKSLYAIGTIVAKQPAPAAVAGVEKDADGVEMLQGDQ